MIPPTTSEELARLREWIRRKEIENKELCKYPGNVKQLLINSEQLDDARKAAAQLAVALNKRE